MGRQLEAFCRTRFLTYDKTKVPLSSLSSLTVETLRCGREPRAMKTIDKRKGGDTKNRETIKLQCSILSSFLRLNNGKGSNPLST
jgi:hypothetical protein